MEFGDITGNQRGLLRIGIAHTRCRAIMPSILPAFAAAYPQIEVRLLEDVNDQLRAHLTEGTIDLAIAHLPEPLPGCEQRDFYREEVVLLLPRAFPAPVPEEAGPLIDLAPFAAIPFLLGNPSDIGGQIGRERIRAARFQPVVRAQSDNIETLLALCASGMGACFSPRKSHPGRPLARRARPAADLSPRAGRRLSHPLRLSQKALPVEAARRLHDHRPGEAAILRCPGGWVRARQHLPLKAAGSTPWGRICRAFNSLPVEKDMGRI